MSYFKNGTNSGLPEVGAPTEPQYAGFWRRVAAHLIDGLIIGLTMLALILMALGNDSLYVMTLIVPTLISIFYQLHLTSKHGATFGKMAMGIKIVRLDGSPIGFHHANLRYLPYLAFAVIGVLGNVDAFNNIPVPSIFFEQSWTIRSQMLQQHQPAWALLSSVLAMLFVLADMIALLISKKKLSVHDNIAGTMVIKVTPPAQS